VIHSARTGPYARKIARFLPLDSLAAKTKAEWKKSAMVVLVQQWRSMKILLPKRGQVEKYCTYEFRASRAMVVIATKDTATLRTPGLYVRRLEGVGLMVRGESHCFTVIGTKCLRLLRMKRLIRFRWILRCALLHRAGWKWRPSTKPR